MGEPDSVSVMPPALPGDGAEYASGTPGTRRDVLEHLTGGIEPPVDDETFLRVLDDTIAALDAAELPYLVMGGIASAVTGRDRWTHDVDVYIRPQEAWRALAILGDRGFSTEETYWDWLYKAIRDDVVVDLIFRSTGNIRLDDEMLARSQGVDFHGVKVPLIPPEDLIVIKAIVHD